MRDGAAAERDRTIAELDAALRAANQKAAMDDPVAIAAAKKEKADAVLAARQELAHVQAQPADAFAGTGPDTGGWGSGIGEFFADLWQGVNDLWENGAFNAGLRQFFSAMWDSFADGAAWDSLPGVVTQMINMMLLAQIFQWKAIFDDVELFFWRFFDGNPLAMVAVWGRRARNAMELRQLVLARSFLLLLCGHVCSTVRPAREGRDIRKRCITRPMDH